MKLEMPTEPFEILRYALRHGSGAPPFDWTVEFGDDAAIARAWRAEKTYATLQDVLYLLRGWDGLQLAAAAVATSEASRVRGLHRDAIRKVAALARIVATGKGSDQDSADLRAWSRRSEAGLPVGGVRVMVAARIFCRDEALRDADASLHSVIPMYPDTTRVEAGKWLSKNAPPPTWAEIHSYVARRAKR